MRLPSVGLRCACAAPAVPTTTLSTRSTPDARAPGQRPSGVTSATAPVALTPAATAASRNAWIDQVKAVACLLIIGHHLAFYGPMSDAARPGAPALVDWFYDYGRMAVQVFLVLGGYLAARGLAPAGAPRATDPMRLIGHRFARLALPYCAALALTILVNEAVREFGFRHESVSDAPTWDQILAHLLLVQSIGGWESLSAGVWYVAIDFQLFALCALWFWLSLRLGGTAQGPDRTSAAPTLPTLAQFGVIALGCASLWWWNQAEQLDVWALYFVGAYALGMMAWWAAHSPNVLARCGWLAAMLACGAIALTLEWRDRIALAWAAALALAVCSAVHWPEAWRRARWAPLAWVGQRSYSIFLIHFAVCLLVNAVWSALWPSGIAVNALGMLVAMACSVGAGALLYRGVESRQLSWMRLLSWQAGVLSVGALAIKGLL